MFYLQLTTLNFVSTFFIHDVIVVTYFEPNKNKNFKYRVETTREGSVTFHGYIFQDEFVLKENIITMNFTLLKNENIYIVIYLTYTFQVRQSNLSKLSKYFFFNLIKYNSIELFFHSPINYFEQINIVNSFNHRIIYFYLIQIIIGPHSK